VKEYLYPFGYEYVVIDYLWFQDINDPSKLYIDEYGRLQPDPNRYPHSADGSGFKWIGEQIHNLGLKFGIHVMRGISQTAIDAKSKVYGTNGITADMIVEPNTECNWYNGVSALDMNKNGSQQFENSLYQQYSEWKVDFIKNDCVYGGNYVPDQIESVSKAIVLSGREMVYSLSPGNYAGPSIMAQFIHNITNMYRLTGDDWDKYSDITQHFNVVAEHAKANLIGASGKNGLSWPDSDMLPFGLISTPGTASGPTRMTNLTPGQQRIQFTLWCIARSPLMFGGVAFALSNDSFTRELITNKMALSVNYNSTDNRQLASSTYNDNNPIAIKWAATQGNDYYVALFNVDGSKMRTMNVSLNEVTNNVWRSCDYTDIWESKTGKTGTDITMNVALQDVTFLFLENCS